MTDANPRRAAIYCRVSTEEQAEHGTSIDTQRARCRAHIEAQGWPLVEEFIDEGVSGAKANRPALDRMMAAARGGGALDVVVVTEIDRFSRDLVDGLLAERELKLLDVDVVYVSGPSMDVLERQMRGAFAEEERRKIRERMMRGLVRIAEEGYWPGGPPPYGFAVAPVEGTKHKRLVVNEDEAAVLRQAVDLMVDHRSSTHETAERLNALGHRTRTGQRWTQWDVRRHLTAETLGGTWTYGRRRSKGGQAVPVPVPVTRIITAERHAALTVALSSTAITRGDAHPYPLTGHLHGLCGQRYVGHYRVDRDIRYYRCTGDRWEGAMREGEHKCGCARVHAEAVETAVWTRLCDLLADSDALVALVDKHLGAAGVAPDDSVARIDTDIAKLDRAIATAGADGLRAGLEPGDLDAVLGNLVADRAAKRREKAEKEAWAADAAARDARLDNLRSLAGRAERLRSMNLDEQAQVLGLLDVRIDVTGWEPCATCDGKGRVRNGKPGGASCTDCRGMRQRTLVQVTGFLLDDLAGSLEEEDLRPSTCSRP